MRKAIVVALIIAGVWWLRRSDKPPQPPRLQAAVLADGFATLVRDGRDGRRVVEVDREARDPQARALRLDREVRLVGTRAGTAVGWQEGNKVKLGTLDVDGRPIDVTTWGKRVLHLCEGAASDDHHFAVGWLESDGRVWIIHGPLARAAGESIEATAASSARVSWCGVAAAERNVALVWRDGDRLFMNLCGPRGCPNNVVRVPISNAEALVGFGCVADSCLFASRDQQGATKLVRVTDKARATVKPLDHATGAVTIVGAGTRAFAIGYLAADGQTTIQRVTVDGALTNVAHFPSTGHPPALAWSADKLLVVLQADDEAESLYAFSLPR